MIELHTGQRRAEGKQGMTGPDPTILIFAKQDGLEEEQDCAAQPTHVKLDTVKSNLRSTIDSVKCMVNAMQGAVDGLSVSHIDIGLVISADGTVGLLGAGSGASAAATLTVRLQSYRNLPF
jgi:hypothetical protein